MENKHAQMQASTELALQVALAAMGPMPAETEKPERTAERSAAFWSAIQQLKSFAMEFDRIGFSVQCPGLVQIEAETDHVYDDQGSYFVDVQTMEVTRALPEDQRQVKVILPTCEDDPLTDHNSALELYDFAGLRKPGETDEEITAREDDEAFVAEVVDKVLELVSPGPIREYMYFVAQEEGVGRNTVEY